MPCTGLPVLALPDGASPEVKKLDALAEAYRTDPSTRNLEALHKVLYSYTLFIVRRGAYAPGGQNDALDVESIASDVTYTVLCKIGKQGRRANALIQVIARRRLADEYRRRYGRYSKHNEIPISTMQAEELRSMEDVLARSAVGSWETFNRQADARQRLDVVIRKLPRKGWQKLLRLLSRGASYRSAEHTMRLSRGAVNAYLHNIRKYLEETDETYTTGTTGTLLESTSEGNSAGRLERTGDLPAKRKNP